MSEQLAYSIYPPTREAWLATGRLLAEHGRMLQQRRGFLILDPDSWRWRRRVRRWEQYGVEQGWSSK